MRLIAHDCVRRGATTHGLEAQKHTSMAVERACLLDDFGEDTCRSAVKNCVGRVFTGVLVVCVCE